MVPHLVEGSDYHPYGSDQESHLSNELFTGRKQRLDEYLKHPVNNIKVDANFQRKEDSDFYPTFNNKHVHFYNDGPQKDNQGLNWQFTNRQRNYFDQYIPMPTRRDPLFRRNNNLHLNPSGDQENHLPNERFTDQKQRLYEYVKYPVDNVELDAKLRRREDLNFYPKVNNQREQFYNDVQQKDDRKTKWKFKKSQHNYFDQRNVQPTRYDPLFRRNNNLHLDPNGDHRSTQFDYYNQQIDDPKRFGRKRRPKGRKKHFDEYPQQNVYNIDAHRTTERDSSFRSIARLDEKRIPDKDYLQNKKNQIPRNEKRTINHKFQK